jgi:Tfp pilus assembly PilM family ATPase
MFKVLPTEYCITKIFPQKDVVIINVGATQTTLSLKKDGDVLSISKIPIGINDLVKKIIKQQSITRVDIIDQLNSDMFQTEKQEFLQIWGEGIGITLQEVLGKTICPKYFYI